MWQVYDSVLDKVVAEGLSLDDAMELVSNIMADDPALTKGWMIKSM